MPSKQMHKNVSDLQKNEGAARARNSLFMVLALAALFLLFMRHAFSPDRSFGLYRDNESMIGPVLSILSKGIAEGTWPLRTDTFLGGMPLYDMPQLSAFYPFYFLWLPLFKAPFEAMYSMHWIVLLHVLIAEINMCIFLRVARVSRCAAVLGAILFAFSANNFTYAVWINILAPYAWLPLYLAGLVGLLESRRELRYLLAALLGMVMMVLASPAQPLIHAVFLTAVFLVVSFFQYSGKIGARVSEFTPVFVRVIVVACLSILVAAPVIVPLLLNAHGMIRWIGPFPPVIGNAQIPFEAFTMDQLTLKQLGGVLFKLPDHLIGQEFVGVLPFSLALVAVVLRARSWLVQALAVIGLYSILSAAGTHSGFAYLNYYLPILNKIREPSRFLVLFQLAIAVLAAIGLDEMRKVVEGTKDRIHRRKLLVTLAACFAISILVACLLQKEIVSRLPSWVQIFALAILIAFVAFSSLYRRKYLAMVVGAWIVFACVIQAVEVRWIPFLISDSDYLKKNEPELDRALARLQTLDPSRSYRVVFEGKIDRQAAAMLASYRNIRTLSAYINPAPLRLFEQMYSHMPSADNYFFAIGAKYLICDDCSEAAIRGFHQLEVSGDFKIYQADSVSPRSYQRTTFDGVFHDFGDFRRQANATKLDGGILFLDGESGTLITQGASDNVQCVPLEQKRTSNYDRFETTCSAASVVVLNEFNDRGWKAYVDGVRTKILDVNGNQMGVYVSSGSHYVEYRYAPTIFYISLLMMVIGIVLSGTYIRIYRR